ncbi:hypothetical protein D8S78_13185 [Natrialba swarupiae]|nr:hypothetical protein [Natrialba swarupiae]
MVRAGTTVVGPSIGFEFDHSTSSWLAFVHFRNPSLGAPGLTDSRAYDCRSVGPPVCDRPE